MERTAGPVAILPAARGTILAVATVAQIVEADMGTQIVATKDGIVWNAATTAETAVTDGEVEIEMGSKGMELIGDTTVVANMTAAAGTVTIVVAGTVTIVVAGTAMTAAAGIATTVAPQTPIGGETVGDAMIAVTAGTPHANAQIGATVGIVRTEAAPAATVVTDSPTAGGIVEKGSPTVAHSLATGWRTWT